MPNTKINQVSERVIHESDFMNKSSYRRFLKGFHRAVEMQNLLDQGYLFSIDGVPMEKDYNFIYGDLGDKPAIGIGKARGMEVWLGCTFCDETGNVYVGKEEMEIFNTVTYINPKHIKKMRKI